MDLASVVAALASVGVRVSGSAPNSSVQVDSSRACPPGLAGPEPSGTTHDLGQHFHSLSRRFRQYSLPPWAPQSGEHRTIRERSKATLVSTFPSSLNLGFP